MAKYRIKGKYENGSEFFSKINKGGSPCQLGIVEYCCIIKIIGSKTWMDLPSTCSILRYPFYFFYFVLRYRLFCQTLGKQRTVFLNCATIKRRFWESQTMHGHFHQHSKLICFSFAPIHISFPLHLFK